MVQTGKHSKSNINSNSKSNQNALQRLKQLTKGKRHFGLNVVELNESENYVIFDFGSENDEINIDIALTILGKKPISLVSKEDLLDQPIVSASKDPSVKNKIFVFRISDLFQDKRSNPSYIVYIDQFRENAILQAFLHSGLPDIMMEFRQLIDNHIASISDKHNMNEIRLIREHIFTFMMGHLYGYSDYDIMAFMFNWGYSIFFSKKSGVKYKRRDIQKNKEKLYIIKDAAMNVLKNMKYSEIFRTYKQKTRHTESLLYKFASSSSSLQ